MGKYIRIKDGQSVPASEAMLNGVLRSGYQMHLGMRFADAVPGKIDLKDSAALRFIDSIPGADATKIKGIYADAWSDEVFRVQRARDAAHAMGCALAGAGYSGPPAHRQACLDGAEYMHALSGLAAKRQGDLYARSAAGDLTADVGIDPAKQGTAYAQHRSNISNAWRGDK